MTLVRIRDGMVLDAPAAASILRMESQQGRQLDSNRTTVDYGVQLDLWHDYKAGRYPHLVLHPDVSEHVYRGPGDGGNAWDTDERGLWLDDNGWIQTNRKELWHREYFANRDNHKGDTMALTNEDLIKILGASFELAPGGRWVNIADALRAIYFYGDKLYAQNLALTAAVQALAGAMGADPAAIGAIVDKAVREALDGLTITLDVPPAAT